MRVAENVPAFLDILNPFFQSGKPYFQLMDIGVNDPVKEISGDDLYNFVSNYNLMKKVITLSEYALNRSKRRKFYKKR